MSGVETGRFEEAREIPVAIFPQHTSRNGDPQLHVHMLWLNKVKTARDGEWRAIDSPGPYREKGARAALAAVAPEPGLTRPLRLKWAFPPPPHAPANPRFPAEPLPPVPLPRTP